MRLMTLILLLVIILHSLLPVSRTWNLSAFQDYSGSSVSQIDVAHYLKNTCLGHLPFPSDQLRFCRLPEGPPNHVPFFI